MDEYLAKKLLYFKIYKNLHFLLYAGAVSYTHLDVYKRQVQFTSYAVYVGEATAAVHSERCMSVSYTHLDVYKRQV